MSHNPLLIANKIIELKNNDLTIMELLKLQYIAHGYLLAFRKTPLFKGRVEAWPYGPVIPEVYNAFKPQGIHIKKPIPVRSEETIPDESCEIIRSVIESYKQKSGWELSALTHIENSPWTQTVTEKGFYSQIPDSLTQSYYERLISDET
jgi:uncharacterized phage-associated protein